MRITPSIVLTLALVGGGACDGSDKGFDETAYCVAIAQNVNGAVSDGDGNPLTDGYDEDDRREGLLRVASLAPPELRTSWEQLAEFYFPTPNTPRPSPSDGAKGLESFEANERATGDARDRCGIAIESF